VTATVHIGTQDYTSNVAHQSVTVFAVSVTIQTDPGNATLKALVVEGSANAEALVLSRGWPTASPSASTALRSELSPPRGVPFAHLLVYGYGGTIPSA